MGVETVAVYSDADRDALHVEMADQSVYIGPSPASESYLAIDKLIAAALESGAEAIHPGYGFLSENADFCRQCGEHNIAFIGPPLEAIMSMGSKSAAKTLSVDKPKPGSNSRTLAGKSLARMYQQRTGVRFIEGAVTQP
mgnify:CR=1 FL=1